MRPYRLLLAVLLLVACGWGARPFAFTRLHDAAPAQDAGDSRAASWIDYDGDGDLDLYVTNGPKGGADNFLYRNDDGALTRLADNPIVQDGSPSVGSAWGDYDNDGDLDLYVTTWYGLPNLLYENCGAGAFRRVTEGPIATDSSYAEAADWGDYDGDGDLDLYVTHSAGDKRNALYQNQNGEFVRYALAPITTDTSASRGATWIDYDGDGDLDLYVPNENQEANDLYRNDLRETGQPTFTALRDSPLAAAGGNSMSASWGDYDGDADLDVLVTNWGQGNALYRNDGGGQFVALTEGPVVTDGGASFGSSWADLDADGDLDLYIATAFARTPGDFFYENTGGGVLVRQPAVPMVGQADWTYGLAWADYDDDGDLDLFLAKTDGAPGALYRNDIPDAGASLHLRLHGRQSNASAFGAMVYVWADVDGTGVRPQVRVLQAASGYGGQTEGLHVGLGSAVRADSVVVHWPAGGISRLTNVPAGELLVIAEDA